MELLDRIQPNGKSALVNTKTSTSTPLGSGEIFLLKNNFSAIDLSEFKDVIDLSKDDMAMNKLYRAIMLVGSLSDPKIVKSPDLTDEDRVKAKSAYTAAVLVYTTLKK